MDRGSTLHPRLARLRIGLVAALLVLGVDASSFPDASVSSPRDVAPWQPGRPVAIAAEPGRARFSLPTSRPGSRTLVIVSALGRSATTYPIRLAARSISPADVIPPSTAPESPARQPDLVIPPLDPIPTPTHSTPPHSHPFHLMVRDGDVASTSNYRVIHGKLRAIGQRVQVYVDADDDAALGDTLVRDVIATFDNQVFPVAARTIGTARDVDGDGRFTVLLSSWLTRLAGGRHAVDGFVRGADLDPILPAPYSNHCDMMYLSTALDPGPHLRTILAHEYTHAVTFSAKALTPDANLRSPANEEEGWLDEALAHLVEDMHGFSRSNLDYRVSAFLSQTERYRLVVEDYYAADLFRSHGNRGATYLFLRWCADRFGPNLVPALVRSPRQGVANLEAATGRSFADLYRAWSIDLYAPAYAKASPGRPPGDWLVAGPRAVDVRPDDSEVSWSSASTASHYLLVDPSPEGAIEVSITAPPAAALQVTAVPLPDDLARLELIARPGRSTNAAAEPPLNLVLSERNGTEVTLSGLGWEPLIPGPDPRTSLFRHAGLDARALTRAFGTGTLPPLGHLASAPIPPAGALRDHDGPLVLKAVGVDARGRRVSAWTDLAPHRVE